MTTSTINANFKIKINGLVNGKKVNSLFGVSGAMRILEETKTYDEDQEMLFHKLLNRAFNSMDDKCVCKLRRGIRISFYRY